VLEEIDEEGPMEAIPEPEALMPHEVVLADAELEVPQLCLYHTLLRDYEENRSGWRMTLMTWTMTQMKATLTWTSGFLKMEIMTRIELLSLNLKFRSKIKFLGFT
jgi:hypothetical protein